jgi:stress responsive alpha/beta barrel protein
VIIHVVLISFRPDTTPEQRQQVLLDYQALGERCGGKDAGILFWQVDRNLDQRKNWHLVELAAFRDDAALQRFREHSAHAQASSVLREIADWAVGDIRSGLSLNESASS